MKTKTKENKTNEITIKQLIEEFKNKEFEKIYLFNDLSDFSMTLSPRFISLDGISLKIYLEGTNSITLDINKIKLIKKSNIISDLYRITTTYE